MQTAATSTAKQIAPQPTGLLDSIKWNLSMMACSADADAETVATHRVLRAEFNMNPDPYVRGDA